MVSRKLHICIFQRHSSSNGVWPSSSLDDSHAQPPSSDMHKPTILLRDGRSDGRRFRQSFCNKLRREGKAFVLIIHVIKRKKTQIIKPFISPVLAL